MKSSPVRLLAEPAAVAIGEDVGHRHRAVAGSTKSCAESLMKLSTDSVISIAV